MSDKNQIDRTSFEGNPFGMRALKPVDVEALKPVDVEALKPVDVEALRESAAEMMRDVDALLAELIERRARDAAVERLIAAAERLRKRAIKQSRATACVFCSDIASLGVALAAVRGEKT